MSPQSWSWATEDKAEAEVKRGRKRKPVPPVNPVTNPVSVEQQKEKEWNRKTGKNWKREYQSDKFGQWRIMKN